MLVGNLFGSRLRKAVVASLSIGPMAVLAGCGGSSGGPTPASSSSANTSQSVQTVHMGVYPGALLNLPLYVAQEEGFCARQNLDCKTTNVSSGPLGLQLLTAGSLQFFYGSTDVTLEGVANGLAVKIVSGIEPDNFYTLEGAKGQKVTPGDYSSVMHQLAGKKIGVNALGAGSQLEVEALFAGAGLSPTSASYVAVGGPSTQFTALKHGEVSAAMISSPIQAVCKVENACSPLVDLRKGAGPGRLKALNGAFTTVVSSDSYISSHKTQVTEFVTALKNAIAWLQDPKNLNAAVKIAASHVQYQGIPNASEVIRTAVASDVHAYGTTVNPRALSAFSSYLVNNKLIHKAVNAQQVLAPMAPR